VKQIFILVFVLWGIFMFASITGLLPFGILLAMKNILCAWIIAMIGIMAIK
jgi:hypothetical protein